MKTKNICPLQALVLICNDDEKLEKTACETLKNYGVKHELIHHATGTAPSAILDMLGVGTTPKIILSTFIPTDNADEIIEVLDKNLKLEEKNKGIAFTLPITGMASNIMDELEMNHHGK